VTPTRLLVVQHEDGCGAAMLVPWLAQVGVACQVLPAHRSGVPVDLGDRDGLLVLGGSMGAAQDGDHPWLAPTRALIAATVDRGLPFLGICLGHQLAALALGGRVEAHPRGRTIALHPWGPNPAGRADPLTSALAPGVRVLHVNSDVVTRLPAGATALAGAPDGTVQAARLGERAWGVQFHPEVTGQDVAGWGDLTPAADRSSTLAALRADETGLQAPWRDLVQRFGQLSSGALTPGPPPPGTAPPASTVG
jgi:GMP synthase (glutamine-hydrolysing)